MLKRILAWLRGESVTHVTYQLLESDTEYRLVRGVAYKVIRLAD